MPLLVQSLTQKEENLLLSTLETLYGLILDAPEIITRQVTSLIPQFLGLSKCDTSMVCNNVIKTKQQEPVSIKFFHFLFLTKASRVDWLENLMTFLLYIFVLLFPIEI